jgi:hypothetical protein
MRALKAPRGVAILAGMAISIAPILALAGCGSSKKAKGTTATGTPVLRDASYNVALSGAQTTPSASAHAVVTIEASRRRFCWRFSALKGFPVTGSGSPEALALIQASPKGNASHPAGIQLGLPFSTVGCEATATDEKLIAQMETQPEKFYLGVFNIKTGAALRGRM